MKYAQENDLPKTISEKEYIDVKNNPSDYPDWYVGLVGFCGSFGAKYFGGFARRYNKDGTLFDVPSQAINSLRKQRENIRDIKFKKMDFRDIPKDKINNYVIYCDIPYKDTTKYKTKYFPHEEFYNWVKIISKTNKVLISEYWMPEEFECIWSKEHYTSLGSGVNNFQGKHKKIEKLYTY